MTEFVDAVGIGAPPNAPSLPRPFDGSQSGLEVVATDDSPGGRCVTFAGIGTYLGVLALHFFRARGTKAAPLPVLANDTLMSIGIRAWDGTSFAASSAAIQAFSAEPSDGKSMIESYITLETSPGNGFRYRWLTLLGNGQLKLSHYGAGVLTSDASGNITSSNALETRIATLESRVAALEAQISSP